jgi:Fungalysin metallopeptidase (M36)/SdrD B-like domain/Fungalysin/Thermolysin Propeptide Motif/Domain of unknown function (DUF4214)
VFRNWYRAWVSRNRQLSRRERRRASRERDRARSRPQVESLEDRTLLSNYLPPTYSTPQLGTPLTDPSSADPLSIAQGYLVSNAAALGLNPDDAAHVRLTSRSTDKDTGVTHLYFVQQVNGLDLSNTSLAVHVTAQGQVISANAAGVKAAAQAAPPLRQPALKPTDALAVSAFGLDMNMPVPTKVLSVASDLTGTTLLSNASLSQDPIPVNVRYVATETGVALAYDLVLRTPDDEHWYDVSVDGTSGAMLQNNDWVDHASYKVFPLPQERPIDVAPNPTVKDDRTIVVNPADPVASPLGWHDTGVTQYTDTRGNNVFAHEDIAAADNGTGFRPDGGPSLDFTKFPYDPLNEPASYQSALITNLFYWNNIVHDIHYHYGFDEAAGNFQVTNFSGQGLGGDPVDAEALDGSGTDNANFATPPDGQSPRMQMFVFTSTSPNRDSDFESTIMVHEYGHGVSNRLTGGPANANALIAQQSAGMGEGWSDWWALMFTQDSQPQPVPSRTTARGIGTYTLGQPPDGPGIRLFPYSFNMTIDPHTLDDYNSDQEVHDTGEIWTSALWDMNVLLVERYGYDADLYTGYDRNAAPGTPAAAGNKLALQLVMDALKLQPANPSFTDARNAILNADLVLTGGANYDLIWQAFARRGMGFNAKAFASDSLVVNADFSVPPQSVRGRLFEDTNGDGVEQFSEPGLSGWVVFLDTNGNGRLDANETSNITDAFGGYVLPVPGAGTYRVMEVVRPGFTATTTNPLTVTVPVGADSAFQTFGNFQLFTISGQVFHDINGNGVKDGGGEPGLSGWVVFNDNVVPNDLPDPGELQVTTSGGGNFSFLNQGPGLYRIRVAPMSGWVPTTPDLDFTAVSGQDHTGVQIGRFQLASISGRVFEDTNGDGFLQTGEGAPPNGWVIDLQQNGVVAATVTTDASGSYSFTGLPAGTYRVRERGQAGWVQTSIDPTDIVLLSGANITNVTFGDFRQFTLSGHVFNDVNGNGTQDAGDGGLEDWVIGLDKDLDGVIDFLATTDVNGDYFFPGLGPGNYRIREIAQPGWVQRSPNPPDFSAQSGVDVAGRNFGNFKLVTLSGQAFSDLNGNGIQDTGEPALTGWVLQLTQTAGGTLSATATTDASGNYQFTNLGPGTYRVRETVQAGWTQTTTDPVDVTVSSGTDLPGRNFGNFKLITLSGQAFNDLNGNGAQDAGEPALAGWVIQLDRNADGTVDALATTNASGNYTFANLGPGTYRVREAGQSGWLQTTADPGDVTASSGTDLPGRNFGNFRLFTISGQVFNDLNGNGVFDSGEPGAAGVVVQLDKNADGTADQTATTDASGNFGFANLGPGLYRVREVGPTGSFQTTLNPADITGASGLVPPVIRFGNFTLFTISGLVFDDTNGNGVLDSGEPGTSGVVVQLDQNADGSVDRTATTDAGGSFSFANLGPGLYRVREVGPAGSVQTTANPGDVTGSSGLVPPAARFGNFRLATIQGQVFEDSNGNNARDPGEPTLSGWVVFLDTNNDGQLSAGEPTATSDSGGNFRFTNLGPGTYRVREVLQAGFLQSTSAAPITPTSGQVATVDVGNFRLATITGVVFRDTNGNGTQDGTTDPGLAGWVVFLDANNNGALDTGEATATTDANGAYSFGNLNAAGYRVRVVLQPGFVQTTADPAALQPQSGQSLAAAPIGVFQRAAITGQVFLDKAGNGTRDPDDTPIVGAVVFLDANGNSALDSGEVTATTNAAGTFTFANLGPGTYRVRQVVPPGFTQTGANPPDVTPTSGQTATAGAFGRFQFGSVTGRVFNDVLGNGQDTGGAGVSGRVIFADVNNNGVLDATEPRTTTDAAGNYALTNLGPGTYPLREVVPPGFKETAAPQGVQVTSGTSATGQNFGSFALFSIDGLVFGDTNGNGRVDGGEAGLGGQVVFLDANGNGALDAGEAQTTTSPQGIFVFSGLGPGTYRVRLAAAGVRLTTPAPADITGMSGTPVTGLTFGTFGLVTLSGRAFRDTNADGSDNGGAEPGQGGFPISLFQDVNGNGRVDAGTDVLVASTVTGPDGTYSFGNVGAGQYLVREERVPGWLLLAPAGGLYVVSTATGQSVGGLNFVNLGGVNASFVYEVYLDVLGRRVDPSGFQSWTAFLASGGTRAQVVQGIEASAEYRLKVINDLYFAYLGRAADAAGIQSAFAVLAQQPLFAGAPPAQEQLRLNLLGSAEYFARAGSTNAGFVAALYRDILGRAADAGSAGFVASLNAGTSRVAVARGILDSAEGLAVHVQSLYRQILHRDADAFGLQLFSEALRRGVSDADIILALASSPEYVNRL